MIPLRFFRDKTHVYVNNPDGTTIKMSIAEFESMLNGEGGSDIPAHSSSNMGDVLSVDANGDLVWKTLPPAGGGVFHIGLDANFALDKKWSEINTAIRGGNICIVDFDSGQSGNSYNYSHYLVLEVSRSIDTQSNPVYAVSTVAVEGSSSAVYKFSTSTEDGYPAYVS